MTFNVQSLLKQRLYDNLNLHTQHINPQFAKVLRTIGFDKHYTHAEGSYLYDHEGRRYIDFLAGYGVFNLGRNHPVVRDALKEYLETNHASLVQMEAPLLSGLLAEELKKNVPSYLDTVYFTNSGTEGIETAIKFARCATGKPRILYCHNAFHGLTNGSLSLNGADWFREGFEPLLPECNPIPLNDLDALEQKLKLKDVAGFVIEPIQGKTLFIANDDYLRNAQALCKKYGALLIIDEVQTGLGRSGKLFAFEYADITPDILIISKALSGGYIPVGAVLTNREIYGKVFSSMDRCVVHSSTFGQNDMAMVAGLVTLHIIEQENLVAHAQKMGELLLKNLQELCQKFEVVHDVRGRGLMVGIEFASPKTLKLKLGWTLANKINEGLFTQAIVISLFRDYGILTQVAGKGVDIIKLIPPLILTEEDVNYFISSFAKVLERSEKFPGPLWDLTTQLAKHIIKK